MPVGFQSFTDGGVLQIDAERRCYVLTASGSVVSDVNKIATITRPLGTAPLFFIQEGTNGFFETVVGANRVHRAFTEATGQTVKWYEYDLISSATGTFGFQLFNAAGQCTFDAAQRPLVPYGVVPNVHPSSVQSLAINTGRTYAVNFPSLAYRERPGDIDPKLGQLYVPEIIKPTRSGSNLQFQAFNYIPTAGGLAGLLGRVFPAITCLVIDCHDFLV